MLYIFILAFVECIQITLICKES